MIQLDLEDPLEIQVEIPGDLAGFLAVFQGEKLEFYRKFLAEIGGEERGVYV